MNVLLEKIQNLAKSIIIKKENQNKLKGGDKIIITDDIIQE